MSTKKINKNKKIIIGNWKMAPLEADEARKIFVSIRRTALKMRKVQTIVCPPYIFLQELAKRLPRTKLFLGSQDVFWKDEGAYTGEVSPRMVKVLGGTHTIIGHSERRALGETNALVAQKILASLKNGLEVILCVGENERDEHGEYTKFIETQVRESLVGVQKKLLSHINIAYEPVWAIGSSAKRAAEPSDVVEIVILLRKIITAMHGRDAGRALKILYGGSVDEKNSAEFLNEGVADGLLVGRASLDAKRFSQILRIAEQSVKNKK